MIQHQKKSLLLAVAWTIILILCASAWSFHLTSFLDAKGLVLAVGLVIATCLQLISGNVSARGFQRFLPLWLGLSAWILSGFFTARVLSFHIEKSIYLGMVLLAASLASDVLYRPGGRIWMLRGLVFSGAAVGLLALLQYAGLINLLLPPFPGYNQRAYSVFGNQNLLGGYMAFNLALLVAILPHVRKVSRQKFLFYLIIFMILLGALLVSETRSAWLAAAIGCVWGLAQSGVLLRPSILMKHKKRFTALVLIGLILLFLGAPLAHKRITTTFSEQDVGGNSRIWFWTGAKWMIAAHPLFGVGLGNYAYWSPWYQGLALEKTGADNLYHNELHTVHAHSEPLEILAETGIIGSLFLAWFLLAALHKKKSLETVGLITLGIFACLNTISHSPPHLLAGLLLAGYTMPSYRHKQTASGKISGFLILSAVLLFVSAYTFTTLIPSVLLNNAEQTHIAKGVPEPLYLRSLQWPWPNPQANENYAISLMDESRYNAARVQLEEALKSLDTGRVHLLLAICAEAEGDREAVQHHAKECLYRWPGNIHAWHLAAP